MKILIADDQADSRARIKQAVQANSATDTVWEAGDGEQAVLLTRKVHPDVVLMDLTMPRIDGLEATRLIKEKQPEVRVIVLSAHRDRIYRRAALRNGADRFLPKPGSPAGFATLRYVSSPSRPVRSATPLGDGGGAKLPREPRLPAGSRPRDERERRARFASTGTGGH